MASDAIEGLMFDRLLGKTADDSLYDPAESWEGPGNEADLRAYTARRLAAYALRPSSPEDVPPGSMDALGGVLGRLTREDLVVVPRTPRVIGSRRRPWVVTPTSVLAVGDRAVALWVDAPGPGVAAIIPFDEVAAIVDRTILLLGRLEIIGARGSIVVRYNTVGRALIRGAMVEVRRSFWPPSPLAPTTGVRPEQLPHKWMALLHSRDMLPHGPDDLLIAAGSVQDAGVARNGVAALSSTELLVATEPSSRAEVGHYGVDLVVVPRPRLAGLDVEGASVVATVTVEGRPVRVPIAVSPSLAAAVSATLVPAVSGAAAIR